MEYTSKNPHYKRDMLIKMQSNHFMQHLGFMVTSIEPGYLEGELNLQQIHLQQNGFVHGGVTSTLADIVMGFSAFTLVAEGEGTVTSDLKIAYLRPGIGTKIIAKGRVIKAGNLLHYCESDIYCVHPENGEILIARGYSTMCVVKHPVV